MKMGLNEIIEGIEAYIAEIERRAEGAKKAVEQLRDIMPVKKDGDADPQEKIKRLKIIKPKKTAARKKPAVTLGGKSPSSRFKGVKKDKKGYKDGRDKFAVNYYDKKSGKVIYLGSFDNELIAAATYQEKAGNKAEAARLRDMAKAGLSGDESKGQGRIWVCLRCGLEFRTKPKETDILPRGHHDGVREVG